MIVRKFIALSLFMIINSHLFINPTTKEASDRDATERVHVLSLPDDYLELICWTRAIS